MIARPPAAEPVLTRWSLNIRDYVGSDTLRGMCGDAEMLFVRIGLDQMEHGYARGEEEFWRSAHAHRCADWSRAWRQASALFTSSEHGLRNERIARDRERAISEIQAKSNAARSTNEKRRGRPKKDDSHAQRTLSVRSPHAGGSLKSPSASDSDSASGESASHSPPTPREMPFKSAEFAALWERWEAHRRHKKAKLTPETAGSQLAKLAKEGERQATIRLNRSIDNGWTGLWFPEDPKPLPDPQAPSQAAPPAPTLFCDTPEGKAELDRLREHAARKAEERARRGAVSQGRVA